jgi:hypothetical protein
MYVTRNILSSVDATGSAYHSLKPIDTSTSITVGITRYIRELERDQAFTPGRFQAKLPPTLALPRTIGTRPIRTHTPSPAVLPLAPGQAGTVGRLPHPFCQPFAYLSATPLSHMPALTKPSR